MALRRQLLIVVLVGASALIAVRISSGCLRAQTPDLASLSEGDFKNLTIRLERKPCYGTCPTYTVAIHGDGRVEYSGKSYVKVSGKQEGRVEPAVVRQLLTEFTKTKFLSLSDYSLEKCACRRCTDMPSAITEIAAGSSNHRVNHDYGCRCAPKALFDLETAIDKAANTEQ